MNELRRRVMVGKGGGEVDMPYVDLGLPSGLLWAQYNVGAETEESVGLYFSWGNVEGHAKGEGYNFNSSTYNSTPGHNLTGDIAVGDTYDIARNVMGSPWRLPTRVEFKELYDNTDSEWVSNYNSTGVAGRKFMKKSDHSVYIFFPACGSYYGTSLSNEGTAGRYWSSTYYSSSSAYHLSFYSSSVSPENRDYDRYYGFSGRPVCNIYYPGRQGAFVYDTRGKFYTADEWSAGIADGSLDNDDAVGVALISGEHRFVIDKTEANNGSQITFGGYQKDMSNIGVVCSNDASVASLDFDGAGNTTKIINDLSGYTDSYSITGAPAAEACRAAFNGTGYLGALGEWALVYDNKDAINSLLTLVGGTTLATGVRYKTSTLKDANRYTWRFRMSNKAMEERNRYNEDLVRAFKVI